MLLTQSKLSKETTNSKRKRVRECPIVIMVRKVQNVGLIVFKGNLRAFTMAGKKGRKKATTLETVESKRTANKT